MKADISTPRGCGSIWLDQFLKYFILSSMAVTANACRFETACWLVNSTSLIGKIINPDKGS